MEVFFVLAIPIGSVANQATTNQPKNRQEEVENERYSRKATSNEEKLISKSVIPFFKLRKGGQ